jgi:hypothetical protein
MIILAFGMIGFAAPAQDSGFNPSDPLFAKRYADFDFQGKFSALVISDEVNNYYLVDFSLLSTRFEKIYFMNLAFKNGKVVNIDPNVGRKQVWFQSNKKFTALEVQEVFDRLRAKTTEASLDLTDQQKADWLKENDKYR